RSASTSGDAENDIVLPRLPLLDFRQGQRGVVLAGFGGGSESLRPSRHDVLHAAWVRIESWRNLGGVQRAESATGSGTHVDEASPLAQSGCDHVDSTSDLRQSAPDRRSYGGVLLVDEPHNFHRGHAVEIGSSGKNLFSGKPAEVGLFFLLARSRQVMRLSG